jgi:hypothetical protein
MKHKLKPERQEPVPIAVTTRRADVENPTAPTDKRTSVEQDEKRDWLGPLLFGLLMVYPFIAHYLPVGVREYLSLTIK